MAGVTRDTTTIWLHAAAPAKPAPGTPCNGCGVCCASEPCPLGMVASRRTRGRCAALQWHADPGRYSCGLLAGGTQSPRTRDWLRRLAQPLTARWIGAGMGCDSQATADRQ